MSLASGSSVGHGNSSAAHKVPWVALRVAGICVLYVLISTHSCSVCNGRMKLILQMSEVRDIKIWPIMSTCTVTYREVSPWFQLISCSAFLQNLHSCHHNTQFLWQHFFTQLRSLGLLQLHLWLQEAVTLFKASNPAVFQRSQSDNLMHMNKHCYQVNLVTDNRLFGHDLFI